MITIPAHRIENFGRLNSLDALQSMDIESINQYVKNHATMVHPNEQLHVVFTALAETSSLSTNIKYTVEQFVRHDIKVTLLLNSYMNHWADELEQLPCDVIYVDYFLWRTYCELELKKNNSVNMQWNPDAKQFLFLTGKPNKINRIRLLWKLHKQNLLPHAIWSLFVDHENKQSIYKHVPELEYRDFELFVTQFASNPDQIQVVQNSNMDLHYGGIPFDHNLFQRTRFRLIAETGMQHPKPWITEKTWITIANNHPFIMAGDSGTCQRLQQMGFRTFENYLELSGYDNISEPEQRLDAVVENAKHLLTSTKHDQAMFADVEHNRRRFLELGESNQKKLCDFFTNANITEQQMEWYIFSRDIIYDEYMARIHQTRKIKQ
jgi:hypothetical protein